MGDVLTLIGQIMFIACLQIIFEILLEQNLKGNLVKVLGVACYAGSLLLLLNFIFTNIFSEIQTLFRMSF
jgi:hypothetical protein